MARRVRPSHLVLALGAAYLLLVSLKFRRVLDLAAADLAGGGPAAFSSPSSSDLDTEVCSCIGCLVNPHSSS